MGQKETHNDHVLPIKEIARVARVESRLDVALAEAFVSGEALELCRGPLPDAAVVAGDSPARGVYVGKLSTGSESGLISENRCLK